MWVKADRAQETGWDFVRARARTRDYLRRIEQMRGIFLLVFYETHNKRCTTTGDFQRDS